MVTFALKTVEDKRLTAWMNKVDERLRSPDWVQKPFSGRVKRVQPGLFVFEVAPLYPRFVMNMMIIFLLVGLLALNYYGFGFAKTLYWFVGASFIFTNIFWTSGFYQAVVWIQTRKLTGKWKRVERADGAVLRAVLDGKV